MKLSTALQGYTLHLTALGRSPNTTSLYLTYLTRMLEYLDDPDLSKISSQDVQRFYAYMQTTYVPRRANRSDEPLSRSSIIKVWIALRSFFAWSHTELHLVRPDQTIKCLRDVQPDIVPLTESEIKKMLAACQKTLCRASDHQPAHYQRRPTALRDQSIILVLLDTGMRVSELCRLVVNDLDLDSGEIKIKRHGSGRKTRGRSVYIETKTRQVMWSYLAKRQTIPTSPIFVTITNTAMDRNAVRCLLDDLAKRAGVKKANPHKFRHTFAIQYLRNGGDVFTLQRLLGHTSLDMVKRYLAIADVDAAAAHKRASPVENWQL